MGMPLDMSQFGRIEQPTSTIKGVINGVLKNEVENETNLFVTQATVQRIDAKGNAQTMPNFSGQAQNEIGFFVSCTLGLAFSKANLQEMIK